MKPRSLILIGAALKNWDAIKGNCFAMSQASIQAAGDFIYATSPEVMREVLDYIAAQDAEIGRLRVELSGSKNLIVDVYAMLPEQAIATRQAIDKRTGVWFVFGVDRAAIAQPVAVGDLHPDDLAVDKFATALKEKLAKQRAKGYGGWEACPVERLQEMLFRHVHKGDPVDVGNFAMMLWNRGDKTAYEDQWVYDLTGKWPGLAAAVGAVEQDAKRYRWLRNWGMRLRDHDQIYIGNALDILADGNIGIDAAIAQPVAVGADLEDMFDWCKENNADYQKITEFMDKFYPEHEK